MHSWESRIEENHAMNLAQFYPNLGTLLIALLKNFYFRESFKCKWSYHYVSVWISLRLDHTPKVMCLFKSIVYIHMLYSIIAHVI